MHIENLDPFFDESNGIIRVVIETPAGSQNKYDFDRQTGGFMLDRPIHSSLRYPFDYGFVPNTVAKDNDPVDALVMIAQPTFPGCIVRARVIGVMDMVDEAGQDEKIICVAFRDARTAHVAGISDIGPHQLREMEHFFVHIKDLEEGKWAKVKGFRDKIDAIEVIRAGMFRGQRGTFGSGQ
jgi:inorganic pyrophosphatase